MEALSHVEILKTSMFANNQEILPFRPRLFSPLSSGDLISSGASTSHRTNANARSIRPDSRMLDRPQKQVLSLSRWMVTFTLGLRSPNVRAQGLNTTSDKWLTLCGAVDYRRGEGLWAWNVKSNKKYNIDLNVYFQYLSESRKVNWTFFYEVFFLIL